MSSALIVVAGDASLPLAFSAASVPGSRNTTPLSAESCRSRGPSSVCMPVASICTPPVIVTESVAASNVIDPPNQLTMALPAMIGTVPVSAARIVTGGNGVSSVLALIGAPTAMGGSGGLGVTSMSGRCSSTGAPVAIVRR